MCFQLTGPIHQTKGDVSNHYNNPGKHTPRKPSFFHPGLCQVGSIKCVKTDLEMAMLNLDGLSTGTEYILMFGYKSHGPVTSHRSLGILPELAFWV